MHDAQTPHFEFPFRLGWGGVYSVLEQDTEEEVSQSVQVIASTVVGERIEVPEFGIPDQTFVVTPDDEEIIEAIRVYEDRAIVSLVSSIDPKDPAHRTIRLNVTTGS